MIQRVGPSEAAGRRREWVLRDDNSAHYHGIVSLQESPLTLVLRWRASADSAVQEIGIYSLDLHQLLSAGYVRRESAGTPDDVRLRFVRRADDLIYVQTREGAPALPLPHVIR